MVNQKLPEQLERLLDQYNISEYQVISVNERKGRYCLRAFASNHPVLVKWNTEEQKEACQDLEKEAEIYALLKGKNITPGLINKEPFLTVEYIENNRTLRQSVLDTKNEDHLKIIIGKVFDIYIKMLRELSESTSISCKETAIERQLKMYLFKLMLSGPEGTCIHKPERIKNRIGYKILKKLIVTEKFQANFHDMTLIHGDFHLNNELVDASNNVFIIDFENVIVGNASLELAYWYAQMWALLVENKKYIQILDKKTDQLLEQEYFEKELFWKAVSLYKAGISVNSRFWRSGKKLSLKKRICLWKQKPWK